MRPGIVGLWSLAALTAAGLEVHAQAPRLGDDAPALELERWVRRQPVEVDFERAPRPRVIAFVPTVRVQYLRAMRTLAVTRALAGESASIVVVLPPDDAERILDWRGRRPLPDCSFAVDAGGRTRASFQFDGPAELPYVALVDGVGPIQTYVNSKTVFMGYADAR